MLWADLALSAVSADLRFSVRVRLLDVAGGVLDTSEPRGSGGDGAFVVGTQGCEKPFHSSTPPPSAPQPCFVVVLYLCACLILDELCSHWPIRFRFKAAVNTV